MSIPGAVRCVDRKGRVDVSARPARHRRSLPAGRLVLLLLAAARSRVGFAFAGRRDRLSRGAGDRAVHGVRRHGAAQRARRAGQMRSAVVRARSADHDHGPRRGACACALRCRASTPTALGLRARRSRSRNRRTRRTQKSSAAAERRVFALEVRAPAWLETDGVLVAVLYNDELSRPLARRARPVLSGSGAAARHPVYA